MYVPGPNQSVWWDVAEIVAEVKRELRLRPLPDPDLDDARWADLVDVAGGMINTHLDRVNPAQSPVPSGWTMALIKLVIELGNSGVTMSDGTVASYTSDDPMQAVIPLLRGSKSRFGVA